MPLTGSVPWDEAREPGGEARPEYGPIIDALEGQGARSAAARVDRRLEQLGVSFGRGSDFRVDPVPRVIDSPEWDRVAAGLEQRLRAINLFLEDAYGEREAVDAGVIPARVLTESRHLEPPSGAAAVPGTAPLVAGPDLIRDPGGELLVLEDNLRTPSGLAYAVAAREAVLANPALPVPRLADPSAALDRLRGILGAAAPGSSDDPAIALLSDGPKANAWFEHRWLADRLGLALLVPAELGVRAGRLVAERAAGPEPIDVLYNRTSTESMRDEAGSLTPLGEILDEPLAGGRLGCVNPFGSGLADDKAVHCYLEALIRFYLDEPPLVRSVPGIDLGEEDRREAALDRLGELVIKPRFSFGGKGVALGPESSPAELDSTRRMIEASPAGFVAQELIEFSVHPTVSGDRFEPRHVDLRAYVVSRPGLTETLPLALTRFAGGPGELVVNSTQGGGCKDTWLIR